MNLISHRLYFLNTVYHIASYSVNVYSNIYIIYEYLKCTSEEHLVIILLNVSCLQLYGLTVGT